MLYSSPSQPLENTARWFQGGALALWRRYFLLNPLLVLCGIITIITFIASLIGAIVDPKVITGIPGWIKPAKFSISISVYSFTLLWLLTFIQGRRRLIGWAMNVIAVMMIVEIVVIIVQVARGTTSHFNVSTPLNGILWGIMGASIVVLMLANILVAVVLLFQRVSNPAFTWSLRLSLVLCVIGMALGFLMTDPTAEQLATMHAGTDPTSIGGHSVGVVDGGPGLPLLGWSTTGGDLRIPHFIGMHALQILPFLGWLVARHRSPLLRTGHRVVLVWTAGLSYLGLVGLVTWQALRAQPLFAPDALTLQALAVLLGVTALAVVGVVLHARTRPVA